MKRMEELLLSGHIQNTQRITNRHGVDRCLLPTSLHPQNMVRLEGLFFFLKWIHKTGHMIESFS